MPDDKSKTDDRDRLRVAGGEDRKERRRSQLAPEILKFAAKGRREAPAIVDAGHATHSVQGRLARVLTEATPSTAQPGSRAVEPRRCA